MASRRRRSRGVTYAEPPFPRPPRPSPPLPLLPRPPVDLGLLRPPPPPLPPGFYERIPEAAEFSGVALSRLLERVQEDFLLAGARLARDTGVATFGTPLGEPGALSAFALSGLLSRVVLVLTQLLPRALGPDADLLAGQDVVSVGWAEREAPERIPSWERDLELRVRFHDPEGRERGRPPLCAVRRLERPLLEAVRTHDEVVDLVLPELVARVRRCHVHDECRESHPEVGWLMAEECWRERRAGALRRAADLKVSGG